MAVQEEDALPEQAAVLDAIQVLDTAETALAPLDLSDEIKEASIYVLVRALLDAASMLGSVNVVELAMWARWKMKYDTPTLAYQGPPLPALPKGASDELLHWLNVSSAAYKYSRAEFCATSGIPMTDLVATDLRSSTMRPAYVVCLDHAYEAIVLSIRGTHGLHDLLTDAAATNTAFLNGYAHSGMAHAVATLLGDTPVLQDRAIVSSLGAAAATNTSKAADGSGEVLLGVARLLAQCMKQQPSYRVVVCGHSLGGGVAALLTMRLFYLLDFDAAAQAKCGFGIQVPQSPGGGVASTPTGGEAAAAAAAPTVTMRDDSDDDDFVHVTSSPPSSASGANASRPRPPKSSWPLQPYPLHCFVFGPPPVASAEVCQHFEPHITSTVMGADFVPRISLNMLHRLRAEVTASRPQWWQDAVVDLAASRVGQLSTAAVQHLSHAVLAAKDLSSAALGNLSWYLQHRFGSSSAGVRYAQPPPSDDATGPSTSTHASANQPSSADDVNVLGVADEAACDSAVGSCAASPQSEAEASEVYAALARDFIHAQHPDSAASAQVDEMLRIGIQQGQPERILNSGDDVLQAAQTRDSADGSASGAGDTGAQAATAAATAASAEAQTATGSSSPHSTASSASCVPVESQVLSLPGTILHVTPLEDKQQFGYEARIVPPQHFEHMLFTHDMWQHHKRRLYGRALQWLNLRDTPRPRVQLQLPAHLVPKAPPSAAAAGALRASATSATGRPQVRVPLHMLPPQQAPFDADAFLRSVVGSPATHGSKDGSDADNSSDEAPI